MCALLNYVCFKIKRGGKVVQIKVFGEIKIFKFSKKSKIYHTSVRRRESLVNFQLLSIRHSFLWMNIKLNTLNFCTYMNECIANFRDSSTTVSTITKPVRIFTTTKKNIKLLPEVYTLSQQFTNFHSQVNSSWGMRKPFYRRIWGAWIYSCIAHLLIFLLFNCWLLL